MHASPVMSIRPSADPGFHRATGRLNMLRQQRRGGLCISGIAGVKQGAMLSRRPRIEPQIPNRHPEIPLRQAVKRGDLTKKHWTAHRLIERDVELRIQRDKFRIMTALNLFLDGCGGVNLII